MWYDWNKICSKTSLDSITHEQTIACGQLFEGHVVDNEKEEKMHRIIIRVDSVVLVQRVNLRFT